MNGNALQAQLESAKRPDREKGGRTNHLPSSVKSCRIGASVI